jgi:hypothetical protein
MIEKGEKTGSFFECQEDGCGKRESQGISKCAPNCGACDQAAESV